MAAINSITEKDVEEFEAYPDMDNYQRFATKSAIYPGQGTILGLSYCAHKLAGEAGEFNEHFGKACRDDGLYTLEHVSTGNKARQYTLTQYPMTQARREFLIKEIGDVLWYLSALCNELGITLAGAARMNLRKLCDRTARNVLQGGGDAR